MIYLPSILAVNFYFEKKRAFANGITQSGSGIGTFLYSPLTEYLLGIYGWKGTMLILSGLVLNCVACSALYIPVRNRSKRGTEANQTGVTHPHFEEDEGNNSEPLLTNRHTARSHFRCSSEKLFSNSVPTLAAMSSSIQNSPTSKRISLRGQCNGIEKRPQLANGRIHFNDCNSSELLTRYRAYSHGEISKSANYEHVRNETEWAKKPLYKKDVFYSGSLMRIPEYQKGHSVSLYSVPWNNQRLNVADPDDNSTNRDGEKCSANCGGNKLIAVRSMLQQMMGLKLLRNKKFLLCMLSMVMWTSEYREAKIWLIYTFRLSTQHIHFLTVTFIFTAHSSVLTILPDCAVLRGVSRDNAAILLSIIGVTNTAARILAGTVSICCETDNC